MVPGRSTSGIALFTALLIMAMPPLAPAGAVETVGTVVAVRGEAFAVNQQQESRRLALKSPIHLMDTLKTGQGRIQLMFQDTTLITLGRNSEMEIKEYLWRPDREHGAMTTRVKEGTFRIMGGAITRKAPRNFKTETPSATIGIRGSMYSGKVKDDTLKIVLQGGRGIFVMNGQGLVNITRPGFGTMVEGAGLAPSIPKRFTGKDLEAIEDDLEMGEAREGEPDGAVESEAAQAEEEEETTAAEDETGTAVTVAEEVAAAVAINSQETTASAAEPPPDEEPPPVEDPTPPAIVALLGTLGFSGPLSTSIPDSGLHAYKGLVEDDDPKEYKGHLKGVVNWHNRRFLMGVEDQEEKPSGPVFIFGEVTPSGEMSNVNIIGSGFDEPIGQVEAVKGASSFGHFYGADQEALGLTLSGIVVDVREQSSILDEWSGIGAATFDHAIPIPATVMVTGTDTFAGFFFGLAEDMAGPDKNKRLFTNNDPDDFTMTVNRDNGTVSGFLSGTDPRHPGHEINALQIGGSDTAASAVITDNDMIAVLSGANAITTPTGTTGLKTYGNFMISVMGEMLSSYSTWGYWEIAYKEPGSDRDYHVHVPGAMWLTGKRTAPDAVDNLIATEFQGTYKGGARGIGIDDKGMVQDLVNGQTDLFIDFAPQSTMPVSGTLSFDQVTLNVTGTTGAVTNTGFNASIEGAVESRVNGAFYGPAAEGIGGNFNTDMGDMTYHGIFAGDR